MNVCFKFKINKKLRNPINIEFLLVLTNSRFLLDFENLI